MSRRNRLEIYVRKWNKEENEKEKHGPEDVSSMK